MKWRYVLLFAVAMPFLTAIVIALGLAYIVFMMLEAITKIFVKQKPPDEPKGFAGSVLKMFSYVNSDKRLRSSKSV